MSGGQNSKVEGKITFTPPTLSYFHHISSRNMVEKGGRYYGAKDLRSRAASSSNQKLKEIINDVMRKLTKLCDFFIFLHVSFM